MVVFGEYWKSLLVCFKVIILMESPENHFIINNIEIDVNKGPMSPS